MLPHRGEPYILGLCLFRGRMWVAFLAHSLRVSSALVSVQDVTITLSVPSGDGDNWSAMELAVMGDGKTAVNAVGDRHDFQNVSQFADGDFSHKLLQ